MSGTPGFKKQVELLEKHFKKFDAKITRQEFSARQVTRKQPVDMVNLIVSWHPERSAASSSRRTTTLGPSPTRKRTSASGASRSSAPTTAAPAWRS